MQQQSTWRSTAVYATMRGAVIAILSIFIFFIIVSATVDYTPSMNLGAFVTLVAFSLVISYAKELLKVEAIPYPARLLLHFTLLGVAYFFVLFVTTKAFLVGFVIYTVVYAACMGLSALLRHLIKKKETRANPPAQEEYKSRFS